MVIILFNFYILIFNLKYESNNPCGWYGITPSSADK